MFLEQEKYFTFYCSSLNTSFFILKPYFTSMADSLETIKDGVIYGLITCCGSLFVFLEGTLDDKYGQS